MGNQFSCGKNDNFKKSEINTSINNTQSNNKSLNKQPAKLNNNFVQHLPRLHNIRKDVLTKVLLPLMGNDASKFEKFKNRRLSGMAFSDKLRSKEGIYQNAYFAFIKKPWNYTSFFDAAKDLENHEIAQIFKTANVNDVISFTKNAPTRNLENLIALFKAAGENYKNIKSPSEGENSDYREMLGYSSFDRLGDVGQLDQFKRLLAQINAAARPELLTELGKQICFLSSAEQPAALESFLAEVGKLDSGAQRAPLTELVYDFHDAFSDYQAAVLYSLFTQANKLDAGALSTLLTKVAEDLQHIPQFSDSLFELVGVLDTKRRQAPLTELAKQLSKLPVHEQSAAFEKLFSQFNPLDHKTVIAIAESVPRVDIENRHNAFNGALSAVSTLDMPHRRLALLTLARQFPQLKPTDQPAVFESLRTQIMALDKSDPTLDKFLQSRPA